MNKQTLEYKDFQGSVDFCLEFNLLRGKILHINDLVTYEADSISELNSAFQEAVDDYLETCLELNLEPEKPFSGTFNVRIGKTLHRDLAKFSARNDKSINDVVREAIDCHINGRHHEVHHHHYPEEFASEALVMRANPSRVKLSLVQ